MELPSQPEQVLDQNFFYLTGIAMVMGTLAAGAIMVWLANDIGVQQTSALTVGSSDNQASASGEPTRLAGPITEVNFTVHSHDMVSKSQ